MKVYVAGCWNDRDTLGALMRRLEGLGHTITHDWTTEETTYTDAHERNKGCALKDIRGVCEADVLLAVLTRKDYAYRGTSSEIGAALACRLVGKGSHPKIWMVCPADPRDVSAPLPYCLTSCFMHCADEYFTNLEDAVGRLPRAV